MFSVVLLLLELVDTDSFDVLQTVKGPLRRIIFIHLIGILGFPLDTSLFLILHDCCSTYKLQLASKDDIHH